MLHCCGSLPTSQLLSPENKNGESEERSSYGGERDGDRWIRGVGRVMQEKGKVRVGLT